MRGKRGHLDRKVLLSNALLDVHLEGWQFDSLGLYFVLLDFLGGLTDLEACPEASALASTGDIL